MSRGRFIFIVFNITIILIALLYTEIASRKTFYQYRQEYVKRTRLRQQLWQKQLVLESLINPKSVSETIGQNEDEK